MLPAIHSKSVAPTFIDWPQSARKISARFRENLRSHRPIDLNNLKAAILILGKIKLVYGLFDPKMRDWCANVQKLFEEAVDGRHVYIDCEEAAYWFDLMSMYLA